MPRTVWYISKYLAIPQDDSPGGRGFELMRELATQGHRCVVFTSDSNHLTETPKLRKSHLIQDVHGVSVCWIRTLKFKRARSARRMLSWIHFELKLILLRKSPFPRPEAIVSSSLSLLSVLTGMLLRARYRSRLVFEVRDIWPLTITGPGGFSRRNPLVRTLALVERLGYSHSDAIVGTMPNLGEHVTKVLGRNRMTYCIPMGLPDRIAGAGRYEKPPGPVDPQSPFIVGYAGTIGHSNALQPFFDAAEALIKEPGIEFVIMGAGDLQAGYETKYGALSNLSFMPKVPRDEVQGVLAQWDLLFLSTHDLPHWRYGQSLNKLIDYMLAGKPVLAAFSGYPSMLNEAGSGRFVPAGDVSAIVEAIREFRSFDDAALDRMGGAGRSWLLLNRSYRKLAREYAEILFPQIEGRKTG